MAEAPLMLSVSGLRGLVGQSLTPPVAARYAAAFGHWLREEAAATGGAGAAPRVVVGRDSRLSGEMVELAAAAGLLAAGCRVTSLGIVTTPTVAIMAEHLAAAGGLVITASHNPIAWNGIKALRHDGVAPPPAQAQEIIRRFERDEIGYAGVEGLLPLDHDDTAARVHVDRVLAQVDRAAIARGAGGRRLKVVLDSVHGAGGPAAAMLLRELGVELVHLFAEPTGRFPHTPEPIRENLGGLCAAVREHAADVGFAQDPDADRLAIVDEQGTYIGEEYTLALAALHLLTRGHNPHTTTRAAAPPILAANLSTSRMIDDLAATHGARVVRTPVGEANVAAALRDRGGLLGGEGNGGVIFPPVVHVRDSLTGMALVLEMLARRGRPLSGVVAEIPRYAIVKDKVDLRDHPGVKERIAPAMRDRFGGRPGLRLDEQDGVRVDWPGRWAHARLSNTEPILRVIAEARDEAAARDTVTEVRRALGLS